MHKSKIYYKAVIFGVIGILMASIFYNHISTLKRLRDNGDIIMASIESFSSIKRGYIAYVNIQGKKLSAGSIYRDKYRVGDSISVYYLPDESRVVQITRPYYYYIYYCCNTLFLFAAVYLTVAGFLGKGRPKNKS